MHRLIPFISLLVGCGSPPPDTLGDFCLDLAPIACDAIVACFGEPIANCEDEFVSDCCGDDGCPQPVRDISRRDYNACLDDLEDRACAAWTSGAATPASCQTL